MTSQLLREAHEVPAAVARLLARDRDRVADFGAALRTQPPRALLTLARGSSDHAAHYAAYLVMARLGRLVTSLPMSLVTLYRARLDCDGLLALAFSQSGASPDLVEPTREFAARGALTAAFVNDATSPLAQAARWVFALQAGPETSIAATKSCVAQMAAGARFVAAWQDDRAFAEALDALPAALDAALALAPAWSAAALPLLAPAERLLVIGRGTGLALALEAALKLKEVCGLQAEALSGAELRHGPLALIAPGYPVLLFAPRGPAQAGLLALAADLRQRGAALLLAAPADLVDATDAQLPLSPTADIDLDPIAALASLYPMVEALAHARGRDPDRPPHLAKVTRARAEPYHRAPDRRARRAGPMHAPRYLNLYSAFFHAVKINSGLTATSFNKLVDTSFDSMLEPELEAQVDGGFRVRVDTREYHGRVLWVHGSNDRKVSRVVNALLRPGDILLDIGANYSSIGLAAADRVGPRGHVHLFEPQPAIAQAVREAIERSGIGHVSLHELALFREDGTLELNVPAHHSGLGTLMAEQRQPGDWRTIPVQTRRTRDYVGRLVGDRPFGVKIDIEGAEPEVLSDLFGFEGMRFVVFEGCDNERWLFDHFTEAGFAIFGLKRSPLRCRVERVDDFAQWPRWHDFVAVRRRHAAPAPASMHPRRLAAWLDG